MFRSLVLACIAPLLLTSACAEQANEASVRLAVAAPIALVRAAADTVAAVSTGQVETTITVGDADDELSFRGEAAFDDGAGRMALTLDLGELAEANDPATSMFDEPLRIVVDNAICYLRGSVIEAVTGEAGWLSASAEHLPDVAGLLGLPGAGTDPRQLVAVLRGADGVKAKGPADVRGVATTRFDATIDGLDPALGEGPVSVWLDAKGLPRRLQIDLADGALETALDRARVTMVMEFFGYGEPVAIDVPLPEEVIPLGDVGG